MGGGVLVEGTIYQLVREAHAAQSERADFDGRGWGVQPIGAEEVLALKVGGGMHLHASWE